VDAGQSGRTVGEDDMLRVEAPARQRDNATFPKLRYEQWRQTTGMPCIVRSGRKLTHRPTRTLHRTRILVQCEYGEENILGTL